MQNLDNGQVEEPIGEYDAKKDFTTLDCWADARQVKLFFLNHILPTLPQEEKYGLGKQIRSAIISTTANIAEGYGRFVSRSSALRWNFSSAILPFRSDC